MSGGTLSQCPNCGHRLQPWDKFCSQCGQDTLDHPPSLWEFAHEFVLHYVAFEGKLWKSLWALIARPGFLTAEYLAGRKQRYVLPLRLVLTLGLLFFVVFKLGQGGEPQWLQLEREMQAEAAKPAAGAASAAAPGGPREASGWKLVDLPEGLRATLPPRTRQALDAANARMSADPKAEMQRIGQRMLAMAPYAVLVSLPFFAALLKLLYWRQAYGAHFVFAMHLHAAWYGMLLLGQLLPSGWPAVLVWVWANVYPLLALRRVHPAGWWATLGRGFLLALMHWVLLLLGLLVLVLLGALT